MDRVKKQEEWVKEARGMRRGSKKDGVKKQEG